MSMKLGGYEDIIWEELGDGKNMIKIYCMTNLFSIGKKHN